MSQILPRTAALLLFAGVLGAQEYRATLLGVVLDPTEAIVPGAAVTATNIATGVSTTAQANANGNYIIPYLLPGTYRLRVDRAGFKVFERSPIELRVNDRMRVDVALEVGAASDRVTVTAEAPLLETSSASRGQVVDNRQISELPVNAKNPFNLTNIAAGVQYTRVNTLFFSAFDQSAIGMFSINGGVSNFNEFQIDGVSDTAITGAAGPDLAYVPPVEATQEFKVQTNSYDAQFGRTSGGVISLSIKPGTNDLHGAAYEYLRRTGLEANQFSNNASGRPRTEHVLDQYGFELDGPVVFPHVYHGRNRTFFMFSLEKSRESQPYPILGSVPTEAQRQGDFSKTLTAAGQLRPIYDPYSTRPNPAFDPAKPVSLSNLTYIRTPFPGNVVPKDRMEPIALRVLQDIPLPNQAGNPYTQANNFYAGNNTSDKDTYNLIGRVDHTFNEKWTMFGRWYRNLRHGAKVDYSGWKTPAAQYIAAQRGNDGAALDVVGTLSPSTVFNGRLGFNRWLATSTYQTQDLSALGFPKSVISQLQIPNKYPLFNWTDYTSAGYNPWNIAPDTNYIGQASLMKTAAGHSLKFGTEFRWHHFASINRATASGSYSFSNTSTSSNPVVTDINSGNSMASFLLGVMSAGSATINSTPYITWKYPVLFLEDDWQVSRRLTLSLGFRWDDEAPPIERYNRVNRGFDPAAKSPIQVPGLDLKGGLLFAGVGGQPRGVFDPDRNNFQPRFGLAYKVLKSDRLVFRSGFGRYFLPTIEYGTEYGFSQTTQSQVGTADYLPFDVLSNPFPRGLIQPPGSSLGLATQVGQSISYMDPRRVIPSVWQYSAGFQYQPVSNLLVEVSYVGSRTEDLQVSKAINFLTVQQLALGTPALSAVVNNPFYGVLPAATSLGAQPKIQARSLMTPYPQFPGLTNTTASLGEMWYNSLQVKVERRFSRGLSFLGSYTYSKTMQALSYRNAQDTALDRRLTPFDRTHRLVVSGVYEPPFGPGKRWNNRGPVSLITRGWQMSWTAIIQSGTPFNFASGYTLMGDPRLQSGQSLTKWFNTAPNLWAPNPPDTLQLTPVVSSTIRIHTAPQLDLNLVRNFHIRENHRVQCRVSAFNFTNTPIFGAPNTSPGSNLFGIVPVVQTNVPRNVELGFRYVF